MNNLNYSLAGKEFKMKLIGKVEKKNGNIATILVTKVLPCGDSCKNCSAGCKHFSIHIQTEVDNSINEGDIVDVKQRDEVLLNSRVMQYVLPAILLIGSIIIVQLIPQIQNKGVASALALLVSVIASQFISKVYDKMKMKNNSTHFIINQRSNPQ